MSRIVGRRVRSGDQETESTNQRLLRRGSVSTSAVQNRAVRDIKQWPGGPRVRPGDLTAEAVEELDGRYAGTGAFLRVAVPAQTWDGALTLGDVLEEADWPVPDTFPKPGYYDPHPTLPVVTPGSLSWSLTVDGQPRKQGTTWAAGVLGNAIPTGPVEAGQSWALVNDGAPLELGDGELVVQLVDRAGEAAPAPTFETKLFAGENTSNVSGTLNFTMPAGIEAGDFLFVFSAHTHDSNVVAATPVIPDGWDLVTSWMADKVAYAVATRVAVEGDAGTTFTWNTSSSGTNHRTACHLSVWEGPTSAAAGGAVDAGLGGDGQVRSITTQPGRLIVAAATGNGTSGTTLTLTDTTTDLLHAYNSGSTGYSRLLQGIAGGTSAEVTVTGGLDWGSIIADVVLS